MSFCDLRELFSDGSSDDPTDPRIDLVENEYRYLVDRGEDRF